MIELLELDAHHTSPRFPLHRLTHYNVYSAQADMGPRTGEGLESRVEAVLGTGHGLSYKAEIPVRDMRSHIPNFLLTAVAESDKSAKPQLVK